LFISLLSAFIVVAYFIFLWITLWLTIPINLFAERNPN